MNNIEQFKTEVNDIKKSLNELKNNVSISETEKKTKAKELKIQAESVKQKIQSEINSLSNKTDDESKKKKEEAETLLNSFSEIMNLYESIINTGKTNTLNPQTYPETESKGIFSYTKNWIGDQWEDVKSGYKWKNEPGKNTLRALGFGLTGYAAYKGIKALWKGIFWKKDTDEEENEEKKSKKKKDKENEDSENSKGSENKEEKKGFRDKWYGKVLKRATISSAAGGGTYYLGKWFNLWGNNDKNNDGNEQKIGAQGQTTTTVKQESEGNKSNKTNHIETPSNNSGASRGKEGSKNNKETPTENLSTEKLKSFFEKNATNLSVDKIDGKDFFEISYTDKNSNSKVKGIIPTKWIGDSNIYMPGDRSGITETMKQKKFKENITDKNSKKARFIFEGDADKINGTQKSARYNNLINNFDNMIAPMKSAGNNPKINIIGHSRAGATVNKLIGKYSSISNYIILDGTCGVYNNVMKSSIPGKIFYTNGGGTKKYISNYQNKPNLEVIGDYASLGHEAIVPKVLFDDSRTQNLFA